MNLTLLLKQRKQATKNDREIACNKFKHDMIDGALRLDGLRGVSDT